LRDTQPLPAFADELANFLYGVFHWLAMLFPYGNSHSLS
jgi:hypothetical protein